MKRIIWIALTALSLQGYGQTLKPFPLSSVRLKPGPFYEAQQTDLQYILALDAERLLAPFLNEAGIETKSLPYGNWENTGLNGHIGGHYLSALSFMYAATGNKELQQRLNYMIDRLAECQKKNGDGYVGGIPGGKAMWKEIAAGKIEAESFSLNKKWVPLYNIHKLFAGLRDAWLFTGNKKALDVLVKLSDWFLKTTAALSDEQIQQMLRSEHGGLNEIFADVFAITGEEKYLVMAKKFSHKTILDPLIDHRDALTGLHANTQIPKVVGYKRIADLSKDTVWSNAADYFWHNVVSRRSVSIGGNSVREHFHPVDDFSSMIESNQGPETCNTYNMLRLTSLLFLSDPDVEYMDYYERALYNHILSSQHPDGGFVYFTPMRPRHYRVYSQPQESFWCCVGSGLENHGKYGELIYAHHGDDIYVNLFIPSALDWQEKGITLQQMTEFPEEEVSSLNLTLQKPKKFKILIRYPGWVKQGQLSVQVNGRQQQVTTSPSGYFSIERQWKTGDVVTVTLPMHTAVEYLPDNSSWASFVHGPVVLAAATDSTDMKGLKADDSRMGHVADGKFYPVEEAPLMVTEPSSLLDNIEPVKGTPLSFTATDIIYPEKYKNVRLEPFFKLHDKRYMLYWQVTTPDSLERIKQAMRVREKDLLALEALTVDQVMAGEQQPETEHGFKGERTETGSTNGQSWRIARGWFSYELQNKNGEGKVLRVTFAGRDRDRKFDILLNDRIFKSVDIAATQKNETFFEEYPIPSEILDESTGGILVIKFQAHDKSSTGRISNIRLLKKG